MIIKTLSDAVTIIKFLIAHQGKSVDEAIKEADVPLPLRDQVVKYFNPPLEILPPDLILGNTQQLPKCNPDNDSMQQYFGAFQRFLIDHRGWPDSTVETLADTSLSLIRQLPKPDAADKFQTRGLVVGYIQSGKTANMAALIARAVDEGYKLIIVLAGLWKDLRAQTQRRMDQEITGSSDNPDDAPYVEYDPSLPKWVRLTRSGLDGDFYSGGPNDMNPQTPKLAVIKKNTRIESLARWLEETRFDLKNLPAIVIDDEADHGSINTNYGKTDDDGEPINPSATNQRIRDLLHLLPKCVYIGFTATPFANVFIDFKVEEDLYPRDFIATLPEPPGYFGPKKLFGLGMPPSDLSPDPVEAPLLDVIRDVEENDLEEINGVLKSGGGHSRVLSNALLAFILSCSARMARGQNKDHFSMLVHPSQTTEPHRIFADAIKEELGVFRNAAVYPKKFPATISRAKEIWENDFVKTTKEQEDPALEVYDFETVWKFAKSIIDEIEVKVLNTYSEDRLDYDGIPRRYVVVGGNRLSRGLTLEGLSVSVFTRSARKYQYDTLLQMGRWFGYRPRYYDLTRIFVDRTMADRFAELARIEEEMRADLKKYAQEPNPPTPLQLQPIIRSHPAMVVTSRMKMGAGKPLYISFENHISETVTFPIETKQLLEKNLQAAQAFISQLAGTKTGASDKSCYIWQNLPSETIIDFLNNYEFSREARDVNRQNLVNYLKRQNDNGELVLWDIMLPGGNLKMTPYAWAKEIITHKIKRTPTTTKSIRVLSSPGDIDHWREFSGHNTEDSKQGCMMLYLIDPNSSAKDGTRFFTEPSAAEDILGLVFVFPKSKSHATVEYISQRQ